MHKLWCMICDLLPSLGDTASYVYLSINAMLILQKKKIFLILEEKLSLGV